MIQKLKHAQKGSTSAILIHVGAVGLPLRGCTLTFRVHCSQAYSQIWA